MAQRGVPLPAEPSGLPASFLADVAVDALDAYVEANGRPPTEVVVQMNAPQGIEYLSDVLGWTRSEFTSALLGPAEYRVGAVRLRLGYVVAAGRYGVRCR